MKLQYKIPGQRQKNLLTNSNPQTKNDRNTPVLYETPKVHHGKELIPTSFVHLHRESYTVIISALFEQIMKLLTARVALRNQINTGFLFCSRPVCIERTRPDVLKESISLPSWYGFCNEIDEVLTPIDTCKQEAKVFFWLFSFYSLLLVLGASTITCIVEGVDFSISESDLTYILPGKSEENGSID